MFDNYQDKAIEQYNKLVDNYTIEQDDSQINLLKSLCTLQPKSYNIFFQDHKKSGFYIYGAVGRGKSTIMNLYYNNSPIQKKSRLHFNEFIQKIHTALSVMRNKKITNPVKIFTKQFISDCDLLCLDEMQVQDISDAMVLQVFFSILITGRTIVIITSNCSPDDLYLGGLQRELFLPTIELIKRNFNVVELKGIVDYRTQKDKTATTKFFIGKNANKDLQIKFQELTQNSGTSTEIIKIYDREIKVNNVYGKIALFTFAELCEAPLWTADYEEIAKRFSVLFITDIPQFSNKNLNEMKRFIMLIDSLYEHKNQLFCSMKVTLEAIYQSESLPIDFQRTVSRLYEMNSNTWI